MNWAHLHLMLNHLPVVGALAAGILLAAALLRRSDELLRAAFAAMVAVGLVAIAAFLTGDPAEEALEHLAAIPEELVHAHEEAAEVALWATLSWSILGGFGLYRCRGGRCAPRGLVVLSLAGFVVVAGLLGRAANLGGRIRHTELRPATVSWPESGGLLRTARAEES